MLEKTLETPRRYNPPILKEISPEYSLEGLMLKLKFQYFGDLMQRTDSFLFFGASKSLQMMTATAKLKDAYSLEEKL